MMKKKKMWDEDIIKRLILKKILLKKATGSVEINSKKALVTLCLYDTLDGYFRVVVAITNRECMKTFDNIDDAREYFDYLVEKYDLNIELEK